MWRKEYIRIWTFLWQSSETSNYTFLKKINVCVCHVRDQGVLVLARTFVRVPFLVMMKWWWHNLWFPILICGFKLADIWKYLYYRLHNIEQIKILSWWLHKLNKDEFPKYWHEMNPKEDHISAVFIVFG